MDINVNVNSALATACIALFLCASYVRTPTYSTHSAEAASYTSAYAATSLDATSFQKNITLKAKQSPYHIVENISIPKGIEVRVEPGVSLVFDSGAVYVYGTITFLGTEKSPISISAPATAGGFTVVGGVVHAEHILATGGLYLVDAYSSSTVSIADSRISGAAMNTSRTPVSVWRDSVLTLTRSTLSDIPSPHGIDVFIGGSLLLDTVTFSHVGRQGSISAFNSLIQNGNKLRSIVDVLNSRFDGSSPLVASVAAASTASNSITDLRTTNAIEVFNEAFLHVEGSTFEHFAGGAVLAHSNAEVQISQSKFIENKKGIESYNSLVLVNESEFEKNTEYAAIHLGGSFEGKNNWWGSALGSSMHPSVGPYSLDKNPTGTGDLFSGSGNITPWLTQKKKQGTCCSNVLFIPGLEGSRIYKKTIFGFGEKQLWEPSSNADVSKLFLSEKGEPNDKTLYTRDIIEKTNIGFGRFDVEVYAGFVHAMNQLDSAFSIRDWGVAPYDWRMSPNTVAVSGAQSSMESQIERLARTSKTKKVTLIAHSYGGIVTKRLLAYLASRGKSSLIDKVIFVAVPEQGTPSALFALLHGDGQEIAGGYILDKKTARTLAQNMPSAYALLPFYAPSSILSTTTDTLSSSASLPTPLIYGFTSTTTSSSALFMPTISSIDDMYKFIFKEIQRPFASRMTDTYLPIVGNKCVSNKIREERVLYKEQSDPAFSGIEFYNILGVGLDTLKSIQYRKEMCVPALFTSPFLVSPYCGLDHIPNYSKLGDGNVLLGNLDQRWGDKYIFNMSTYNSDIHKNYSHTNIISADPVVSTMMQIMLEKIGLYQLPKYISHYGGSRIVGGNSEILEAISKPTYVLAASETLALSMKDSQGTVSGVNTELVAKPTGQAFEVLFLQNSSANSSYVQVGSSNYILSENIPKEVTAVPALLPPVSDLGASTAGVMQGTIDISLRKLEPEKVDSDGVERVEKPIFEFKRIPINEYTAIQVSVDTSSTTPAVLKAVEHIAGVYDDTHTYLPTSIGGVEQPQNVFINSFINSLGGVGAIGSASSMGGISSQGGFIDIGYIIREIRTALLKSSLRTNFKNRYLLKLKTIEIYNASTNQKTRTLSRKLSKDTVTSLVAIIKDLSRYKTFYYKGGMQRGEAVFLYSQFVKLIQ